MNRVLFKILAGVMCFAVTVITVVSVGYAEPQTDPRGVFTVSVPPVLRGMIVHPEDPLAFDFVLDEGDSAMNEVDMTAESAKLIKYFLTSLTLPEDDLWVTH